MSPRDSAGGGGSGGEGEGEKTKAEGADRGVPKANQSERIYKVEPNGYIFGPLLYVIINEPWAVLCFAFSAHFPCYM